MPKVACLDKFKKVLVGIPEIHDFLVRDGRTFKIPCIDGLAANFDLLIKKRVQFLIVECCQQINMQQVLVGLPMDFGRDRLEMVVAKAMFGFSRQGICCGLGGSALYVKGKVTSRVQSLLEELKKGGSENSMEEIETKVRKESIPWNSSWNRLIDHLVGEKDTPVGEYWELPAKTTPPKFLIDNLRLFSNEHSARTFWRAAMARDLVKRIGPRNGKGTLYRVFNLSWPGDINGKATVTEDAPASENSGPPLDLLVSIIENSSGAMELFGQFEKVFGDNPEMARLFSEKCDKQIELLEKVKRSSKLYADFITGMKSH